mgnify:CR=1 FL=1
MVATTATGVRASRELDELYRTHAAEVFRYAYAVLGNRADAEDVTQTTFVNALRALERGERPRKPANWLMTIAHNLIRQRFRQQQSRPREVELDRDVAVVEESEEGPAIDDLVRALQRIPPTQRQALVLRELEGRSYREIGELLGVSHSALETLLFRARRSLAEELENLVTCDHAELALSRRTDGRLGRKERRRLFAHLDECPSCARVAARSLRYRRAFKALAVLPLPFSLTLFKGAPSAYAAAGVPTIGAGAAAAGTAAGIGTAGVTAKIAVGLAAVAVAGGAGYEGVKAAREPAAPASRVETVRPAVAVHPVAVTPVAADEPAQTPPARDLPARGKPAAPNRKPVRVKPVQANRAKPKPARAGAPVRGRSTAAPGRGKPVAGATGKPAPTTARASAKPAAAPQRKPVAAPKAKQPRKLAPAADPARGRSGEPHGRLRPVEPAPSKKPR